MPRKKKMSAADAAFLRQQELMEGRTPVPEGVLPGQIDMLDGSIAGSTERVPGMGLPMAHFILANLPETTTTREPAAWPHIPDQCPTCSRRMTLDAGWTPMHPPEDRRIQCGNCGTVIIVPQGSYDTLALALRNRFHHVDRYVQPLARIKKQRGAG